MREPYLEFMTETGGLVENSRNHSDPFFRNRDVYKRQAYTSFTGKDASMSGNVKFIIETEGFDDGSED